MNNFVIVCGVLHYFFQEKNLTLFFSTEVKLQGRNL